MGIFSVHIIALFLAASSHGAQQVLPKPSSSGISQAATALTPRGLFEAGSSRNHAQLQHKPEIVPVIRSHPVRLEDFAESPRLPCIDEILSPGREVHWEDISDPHHPHREPPSKNPPTSSNSPSPPKQKPAVHDARAELARLAGPGLQRDPLIGMYIAKAHLAPAWATVHAYHAALREYYAAGRKHRSVAPARREMLRTAARLRGQAEQVERDHAQLLHAGAGKGSLIGVGNVILSQRALAQSYNDIVRGEMPLVRGSDRRYTEGVFPPGLQH